MKHHRPHFFTVTALLCFGMTWGSVEIVRGATSAAAAIPAVLPPTEPARLLPFPTNSPVTFFRRLLALSAEQQQSELASRAESSRTVLQRKLAEYQALPAAERESRFRAMEFHHYLKVLLLAPNSVRSNWLNSVPAEYRSLCEDRLRLWSVLTAEMRQYMLEKETTLRWITRLETATAEQREQLVRQLPLDQQQAIQKDVAAWQSMSPDQREETWRSTRRMFELSEREKKKVFNRIEVASRPQSEKLVQDLSHLTRDQRELYMQALRKYSQLAPDQRARFSQGWERWKTMSEPERDVWRRVAAQIPLLPPLPQQRPVPSDPKSGAWSQPGHGYALR